MLGTGSDTWAVESTAPERIGRQDSGGVSCEDGAQGTMYLRLEAQKLLGLLRRRVRARDIAGLRRQLADVGLRAEAVLHKLDEVGQGHRVATPKVVDLRGSGAQCAVRGEGGGALGHDNCTQGNGAGAGEAQGGGGGKRAAARAMSTRSGRGPVPGGSERKAVDHSGTSEHANCCRPPTAMQTWPKAHGSGRGRDV